jgi:hypothetical protein
LTQAWKACSTLAFVAALEALRHPRSPTLAARMKTAPSAFLIEIHQPLAEINHCKSIKRTELSAIPWVESDSSNSGGIYEKQNVWNAS